MTKLQKHLYKYIMESQFEALKDDDAYMLVRQRRNEAEDRLTTGMTAEQKALFSQYVDEENGIIEIEFRHVFLETLEIVHNILNVPL